jgi:L-fucose mutarotase
MVLKGISPLISPSLLKILAEMGHGDEIVLADAHFPSHSICPPHIPVIRADGKCHLPIFSNTSPRVGFTNSYMLPGIPASALLAAIIPLFELDKYGEIPVMMMETVPGDTCDPSVEVAFKDAVKASYGGEIAKIERFAFYERSKKAFAIVATGETRKYGNVILKKGVTPIA